MKIRTLELFQVAPRWLFLKITTESGICGWGEPVVEGRADTVEACVRELEPYLISRSAGDIEDLWQIMYRGGFYRGGAVLSSAMSGIEQALWDIKGKYHNLPVYEFFGGAVRDKIRVYGGAGGATPEAAAQSVKLRAAQGYTAVKAGLDATLGWIDSIAKIDTAVAQVAAMREAVGNKMDIAVDFHGRVHKSMARMIMRELEPLRLMFVEEPVLCENEDVFAELRRHFSTPIATGERNYTRWGFKNLITGGGVDIIQPDLSHAGGVSECRRIAAMAEAYDVSVAPHCPLGPIALAACLQLDFCTPNAFIQEQSLDIHSCDCGGFEYLEDGTGFEYDSGYVLKPRGVGLGICINEELVRKRSETPHKWKNPVLRAEDGSFAEW